MRVFIAIALPKEIKLKLAKLQDELKSSGADVKWVEPDNIHLTLKFLGEIDDKQLSAVYKAIEESVKEKQAFSLRISSLGAFPKINYPRVIWLGVDKGDMEVKQIAKDLEERIQKIGIPKDDRAFSSHITIGRVRTGRNKDKLVEGLNKLAEVYSSESLEFEVKKITLFKSTLTPKGPIYEAIKETNLVTA
ncbi:MAG: RNA 2',3'-cyclic phosphodiesterase [Candidatus Omnitrophica bacterium]|nr:RNA 2',3'-cyclic phosphodiesterase [Candidatus Omnitrophota bacterium]